MSVNKVVFGGEVLIDLTPDTITEDKLLSGYTAHNAKGESITGSCSYDSDTKDADIKVSEMLVGKTAYARGAKLTGDMPNNEGYSNVIKTATEAIAIPVGFHDGSGSISIDATAKQDLAPENVRQGKTILGVVGTMTGTEGVKAEASKTARPSMTEQTIKPSAGFDYLGQVVVEAIPYITETNAAGGTTYSIG